MKVTRAHRNRSIGLAAGVLLAAVLLVPTDAAVGSSVDSDCKTVEVVFARGSGQATGEAEAERFRTQIESRIKEPLSFNYYELGTGEVDGFQYPAIKVNGWESGAGVFAKVSSGGAFRYGDSVDEGVDELDSYIEQRVAKCGLGTKFILGGYSQGAQVIGETYVEKLSSAERSMVVFNVLLGDPKLYLPEGERPLLGETPACFKVGPVRSEWRRAMPAGSPQTPCETDGGSLGARKPYLPVSFTSTTGLWCADADFVCGSRQVFWDNAGHGTYKNEGGAIDAGVLEAVQRLQRALPPESKDSLDVQFYPLKSGTTGLDVAFVIDSTGSMDGQITAAKQTAADMADYVEANRGRVALVEYRDLGDEFTARVLSPLDESTALFSERLNAITVGGGGDTPEALLHALMTTFNELAWRPGATKAAIVLTDAGYHDPDRVDGSTLDSVAQRSLEIDPVNVYPVVSTGLADYYTPLAESTSGKVILNEGDTSAALEEALSVIEERPVPTLEYPRYYGPVGSEIRFDASGSYSVSSEIVQWDWDWNGDGIYELEGGSSIETHRYDAEFDGLVQLRITDREGLIANYSVPVDIGPEPEPSTIPADSLTATGASSEVQLSWEAGTSPSKAWAITVNGTPAGFVEPEARSVTVYDVERTDVVEFGVSPVSTADEIGSPRLAYLNPSSTSPSTPTPTPSPTPSPTASAPAPPSSPTAPPAVAGAAPAATNRPFSAGAGRGLATTGVDVGGVAAGSAILMILVGAGVMIVRKRRRT